jgi:hypothetical protein
MRLQELTGHESGIVLYDDTVVIENWSSIDGLPRYFCLSPLPIGMGDGDDLVETELTHGEEELAFNAAKQEHNDECIEEDPVISGAWRNENAVVVTIEGWA